MRRASTALPSWLRRFSDSERLLRLKAAKYQESPSLTTPCCRKGSPAPGGSTLITSAPISASIIVQNGPARMRVRSTTLIPDNGTDSSDLLSLRAQRSNLVGVAPLHRDCFVSPLPAMTM